MILGFILLAARQEGISLSRSYKVGDADFYQLRVSPVGKTAPLGNAFTIRVAVQKGPILVAAGSPSPYGNEKTLAKWSPSPSGFPKNVLFAAPGFDFLPFAFVSNDASLKPGEMQAIIGGSVKFLSDKDSVAQVKVWLPFDRKFIGEDSDVEVASRLINHASGTVFVQSAGHLSATRAFTIERLRTKPVIPIPQHGG